MAETVKITEVEAGNRRGMLEAIRDRLAAELDGLAGHRRSCDCKCGVPPDARTIPTLAKELRELLKELDSLPVANEESKLDQLAEQRRRRQAAAGRVSDAAGS